MPTSKLIFRTFTSDIQSIELPQKFTYPFYYEPHQLAILASQELQLELSNHPQIAPLFDSTCSTSLPTGKMFGVLIVQDSLGNIGYLVGFSGKLGIHTEIEGFVPPVFDLWNQEGFFIQEEKVLNIMNAKIVQLEQDSDYQNTKSVLTKQIQDEKIALEAKKEILKQLKSERKKYRSEQLSLLSESEFNVVNEDLIKQSLRDKHELRVLTSHWKEQIELTQQTLTKFENEINQLKEERKQKSNALQQRLFQNYRFLNHIGEQKDLLDIFEQTALQQPPAAAGDCAAPKLLQYAYLNKYTPLAMAEFWWGESPKSEIRKHLHYYPACRGKCEPILNHMLQGLSIDDNPLLANPALNKPLEIVYEDEFIAVINKPDEFLSVPGIFIQDSVQERMKLRYPNATGPLIVHRLDMATSGILLIAKDKDSHKLLQSQFIKKTIEKRYVALLDGLVEENEGCIDLPLRVDLDDRPRQMVCDEYGKPAKTKWEVIERINGQTKVYFYPITGRTHQLRVHASHPNGLNTPIKGDDLYGTKSSRLHLHAQRLIFTHPKTKERMTIEINEAF